MLNNASTLILILFPTWFDTDCLSNNCNASIFFPSFPINIGLLSVTIPTLITPMLNKIVIEEKEKNIAYEKLESIAPLEDFYYNEALESEGKIFKSEKYKITAIKKEDVKKYITKKCDKKDNVIKNVSIILNIYLNLIFYQLTLSFLFDSLKSQAF